MSSTHSLTHSADCSARSTLLSSTVVCCCKLTVFTLLAWSLDNTRLLVTAAANSLADCLQMSLCSPCVSLPGCARGHMCIHMCIVCNVHVYTCIYTCTHVHTRVLYTMYMCIYMCTRVYTCVHVYIHVYTCRVHGVCAGVVPGGGCGAVACLSPDVIIIIDVIIVSASEETVGAGCSSWFSSEPCSSETALPQHCGTASHHWCYCEAARTRHCWPWPSDARRSSHQHR